MGEHETRPAGIHDLRHVGAGVAEARVEVVALEEARLGVEAASEHAVVEQGLAGGLAREAQESLRPMLAGGRRLRREARLVGIVGGLAGAHEEAAVDVDPAVVAGFRDKLGHRVGVLDRGETAGEVEGGEPAPGLARGRQVGLQSQDEAGAAYVSDGGDVAVAAEGVDGGSSPPPDVLVRHAGNTHAEHLAVAVEFQRVTEQDPASGGVRDRPQDVEVGAHGLHQAVPRSHLGGDALEFGHVGECTRDRASVGCPVRCETVGGEAPGTVVERPTDNRRHLLQLGGGRILGERALAHHVVAHGRVPDHAGHVDRRAELLDGGEVLAVVLPVPREPRENGLLGNVLDGFHHAGE